MIVIGDCLNTIIKQLQRKSTTMKVEVARALCGLADDGASHATISTALNAITKLAEGNGSAKQYATSTLKKLSGGGDAAVQAALGASVAAVKSLVTELSSGTDDSAVYGLLQLKDQPEAMAAVVESGGLAPLLSMGNAQMHAPARSDGRIGMAERKKQEHVLELIATLAKGHAAAVADAAGALDLLVSALRLPAADPQMVYHTVCTARRRKQRVLMRRNTSATAPCTVFLPSRPLAFPRM